MSTVSRYVCGDSQMEVTRYVCAGGTPPARYAGCALVPWTIDLVLPLLTADATFPTIDRTFLPAAVVDPRYLGCPDVANPPSVVGVGAIQLVPFIDPSGTVAIVKVLGSGALMLHSTVAGIAANSNTGAVKLHPTLTGSGTCSVIGTGAL